jgi:hypothetical protein
MLLKIIIIAVLDVSLAACGLAGGIMALLGMMKNKMRYLLGGTAVFFLSIALIMVLFTERIKSSRQASKDNSSVPAAHAMKASYPGY